MLSDPQSVLCPVCFASPNKPCRAYTYGAGRGSELKTFHPSRELRAQRGGFYLIEEKSMSDEELKAIPPAFPVVIDEPGEDLIDKVERIEAQQDAQLPQIVGALSGDPCRVVSTEETLIKEAAALAEATPIPAAMHAAFKTLPLAFDVSPGAAPMPGRTPGRPHDDLCRDGVEPCGETHLLEEVDEVDDAQHRAQNPDNVATCEYNPADDPNLKENWKFDVGQLVATFKGVYDELPAGELLFAVRCPCGTLMSIGVPTDIYRKRPIKNLVVDLLQNLLPLIGDHLELLSERIAAAEAVPPIRRKPGHPTKDEIIASYHNHPCKLRMPADAGQEA